MEVSACVVLALDAFVSILLRDVLMLLGDGCCCSSCCRGDVRMTPSEFAVALLRVVSAAFDQSLLLVLF